MAENTDILIIGAGISGVGFAIPLVKQLGLGTSKSSRNPTTSAEHGGPTRILDVVATYVLP